MKEVGRGLCDIAVDKSIGIELKKDLDGKSKVNRLVGQVVGYMKEYDDIIIVLVGKTNKDAVELLKQQLRDVVESRSYTILGKSFRVKIIDKGRRVKK